MTQKDKDIRWAASQFLYEDLPEDYQDWPDIKLFASYDKDEDGITFGDRTMIPKSWIVKIIEI